MKVDNVNLNLWNKDFLNYLEESKIEYAVCDDRIALLNPPNNDSFVNKVEEYGYVLYHTCKIQSMIDNWSSLNPTIKYYLGRQRYFITRQKEVI